MSSTGDLFVGDEALLEDRIGVHFLIVDDDPADQLLCKLMLQEHSDRRVVHCVQSGAEALEYIAKNSLDCIFLDYHLLDGRADTYIEQFAALSPWTPIIVLSGAGNEDKAALALRLGAADYLTKGRVTAHVLERSLVDAIAKLDLERTLDAERNHLIAANEELRSQRREIQSFYHTVSHELKSPITAAREFGSLFAEGVLGEVNEAQKEALNTSIASCDRLANMVDDLFDAARIETGKLELFSETTDLNNLLAGDVESMRQRAVERRISLIFDHDSQAPLVKVDPVRVSQVVRNLIANAIKYTDHGGRIRVSIAFDEPDNIVKVRVVDNGFGIASKHAEFIFDRLYQCSQVDETDVSSQNGMGIGLYLCKQIIHLHGGEISVDSVLGEGSTFEFYLPVGQAH